MKKSLIVLLCALFVISAFTACANQPDDTKPATTTGLNTEADTTEAVETEDINYIMDPDTIAKAGQYKGEKLTILANSGFWPADDIFREEDSEDPVDSAIYNRNEYVKNTYQIDIEVVEDETVATTLKNAYKSGINDYDVAAFCAYEACPLAAENIFQDLTQIENLDLTKKYWDQGLFEGLSIDNKLFYITGDISTKANAGTFLMMFNKKLASDYDLEDLYQVVRDGNWTLDYLNNLIKEHGYVDDGNAKVGVEDKFGMGIQIEAYLAFYFGAGGRMVLKDSDQNLSGDDIREGITAIISIKIENPQFEGQTKQKLGNMEARGATDSIVSEQIYLPTGEKTAGTPTGISKAAVFVSDTSLANGTYTNTRKVRTR